MGKDEVKSLTFVTADRCRIQLERLTKLLVSAFPGSTIYQHANLLRVPHDVLHNKVDAVFLEAEMDKADGLDVAKLLRRQKPDVPVFLISKTGCFDQEVAQIDGCFVLPDSEQRLLDAIHLALNKGDVS